jgi:uncharacterized protein DUF5343
LPLTDAYVQTYGQLAELFRQIRQGQAPDQFTVQHLKDLGFTSSNHRLFLPLLKALGFLTADGKPTPRYHEYRDESQSKRIMTEALREAYGDLFVLRARPSDADKALIEGKFKSTHNTSARMAKLMASTFYSLLQLADLDVVPSKAAIPSIAELPSSEERHGEELSIKHNSAGVSTSLHYNIQIHLPATKDIEVYNAISNP